jgi:hypothetical protein
VIAQPKNWLEKPVEFDTISKEENVPTEVSTSVVSEQMGLPLGEKSLGRIHTPIGEPPIAVIHSENTSLSEHFNTKNEKIVSEFQLQKLYRMK